MGGSPYIKAKQLLGLLPSQISAYRSGAQNIMMIIRFEMDKEGRGIDNAHLHGLLRFKLGKELAS